MLFFICFCLALAFALRAFLLALLEQRGNFSRVVQALFFFLFIACALLFLKPKDLFSEFWPDKASILGASICITIFFSILRIKRGPRHLLFKSFALCALLSLFSLSLALQGFLRVAQDAPLAKVVIPGLHAHSASLSTHLVKIQSLKGDLLAEQYVHGDLVGIRTRVIRVKPFFAFMGLTNLCKIELLHSGYLNSAEMNKGTHDAQELSFTHQKKFSPLLDKLWEKIFFEKASAFWIKSANLQSNYFPLVDKKGKPYQGAFLLTLSSSGVSSLALSDEISLR